MLYVISDFTDRRVDRHTVPRDSRDVVSVSAVLGSGIRKQSATRRSANNGSSYANSVHQSAGGRLRQLDFAHAEEQRASAQQSAGGWL